jgi:hypothetical protein
VGVVHKSPIVLAPAGCTISGVLRCVQGVLSCVACVASSPPSLLLFEDLTVQRLHLTIAGVLIISKVCCH